jgi:hypothetical protein
MRSHDDLTECNRRVPNALDVINIKSALPRGMKVDEPSCEIRANTLCAYSINEIASDVMHHQRAAGRSINIL